MSRIIQNSVVRPGTRCWHWTNARDKDGYGVITVQRPHRTMRASRYSYQEFKGPIPEGQLVLHTCDNPGCVNPEHLWIGSHTDNVRDCKSKGRLSRRRGEFHNSAKLTDGIVLAIRSASGSQGEIAERFGIAQQTVSGIRLRKRWTHLP